MNFEDIPALVRSREDALDLAQAYNEFFPRNSMESFSKRLRHLTFDRYPPSSGEWEAKLAVAGELLDVGKLQFDPIEEILITNGATQALNLCIETFVQEGDGVAFFEPFYPLYLDLVVRRGGNPVLIKLIPPDWTYDIRRFALEIIPKISVVILNNPHNPTGKLFSFGELDLVFESCLRAGTKIILDEVSQRLTPIGTEYRILSGLRNPSDLVFHVGSLSKSFNMPAVRAGWIASSRGNIRQLSSQLDRQCISVNSISQSIIRDVLPAEAGLLSNIRRLLDENRGFVANRLRESRITPTVSTAGHYMVLDARKLLRDNAEMAWKTIFEETGVLLMPLEDFYSNNSKTEKSSMLRLCYGRNQIYLEEGISRILAHYG